MCAVIKKSAKISVRFADSKMYNIYQCQSHRGLGLVWWCFDDDDEQTGIGRE